MDGRQPQANGGPLAVEDVLPPEKIQELKEIKKQPERYARLGPIVWEDMRRDPPAVPLHWLQSGLAFFFGRDTLRPEHRVVGLPPPPPDTGPPLDRVAQGEPPSGGGAETPPSPPAQRRNPRRCRRYWDRVTA